MAQEIVKYRSNTPDSGAGPKDVSEMIDLDDAALRAQGHEAQLERSFTWVGAVGLGFSIANSWLTYAACFGAALFYGGGLTAVFGLILSAVAQWIVLLGLSEMASALPSSGGQYHYTYIIAPPHFKNVAAYVVGMINIVAWWVNTASGAIYTAISVFGICSFLAPGFSVEEWQVYLCYLLVILLTLIPIFLIPHRYVDLITKAGLYLSILGFVLVVIVCLVMGRGSYHPKSIVEYRGQSGWSPGPAWLLAISNGEYAFAAAGASVHIAEELPHPRQRIPMVINLTMAIGMLTAVPWIIAMTCVIQDMKAIQNAFLPSLELFYQATGNEAVATFLQAYLTLLYFCCVVSQWITCSRIAWAFSRDDELTYSKNGLPFSNYWSHIDTKYHMPVRTTLLSVGFCVIYGVLYIASTEAFNSIINTAVLMMNLTYTVPQGILATRGRHRLPKRPYNLGGYLGYAVNSFSVLWMIVSGIFFCFPTTNPPNIGNMNYGSVVICGIFAIIMLLWIERRKHFHGPDIDWDMLNITLQ